MILRCPTVTEVQFGRYFDWRPVYVSDESRADYNDVKRFEAAVEEFDAARYSSDYQREAHCFYRCSEPVCASITLTHRASYPLENSDWHWLESDRTAECRAEPFSCQFLY